MKIKITISAALLICFFNFAHAGNPDRQGEAGAYELLMNPWARSAGLHSLNTSMVSGVEAMNMNVAGLARINKTEFVLSNTQYLVGTGISMNALGFAQKVGRNGTIGVSVVAMNFGDILVTTTDQPEGTGATFSPNFFNLGISYAHTFENKVTVGVLMRTISQTTADLSAFGACIDAGVQYVTGDRDEFKLGIALRNVGTPMRFGGEGLAVRRPNPQDDFISYQLTYNTRSATFDLPSLLNIGLSYDFYLSAKNRLTALGNFTSNSFSRDQVGAGLELGVNEMFMLRAAYVTDIGSTPFGIELRNIYTGLAAGFSFDTPLSKDSDSRFGIDYAWRASNPFNGTHNLSLRFSF
jgi:hypothetical protein